MAEEPDGLAGRPAGVEEQGTHGRVAQEPGRPCRRRPRGRYSRAKETKRSRGRQGVRAAHCTEEVGEPTQRDPMEGRGCRVTETERRKDGGDSKLLNRLNKTRTDSKA